MKKIIIIVSVYTILVLAICLGLSMFVVNCPILIEGDERTYKALVGLKWFMHILPAILLSGFAVSCAVQWQQKSSNIRDRFTAGMFERYRIIFVSSIIMVLILALNQEVFYAKINTKISSKEKAPYELSQAIDSANKLAEDKYYALALQYAKKAVEIAPKDPKANAVFKVINDCLDLARDNEMYARKQSVAEKIERPLHKADSSYTILELIEKSKKCAEEKSWFESHYWAQLAVEACSGTNTSLDEAVRCANHAWNQLNEPIPYDMSEARKYYEKKREGYKAYHCGDCLKSYYIFNELNATEKGMSDPDVIRFLALAKEDVESQYFFFDETEHMAELSNSHKIYFSLSNPDGTKDVFYINSAMDIKKEGGLVRYLEGLNCIHYSAAGKFEYSFTVPYAKAVAQPVADFSDDSLKLLGAERSWRYIPMITLRSVDRDTEGLVSKPVYSFAPSGLPQVILDKTGLVNMNRKVYSENSVAQVEMSTSFMILPMPYTDFHRINAASSGADKMPLWDLNKFLPNAAKYGFSKEIYTQNLLQRISYPFIMLILFVFAASMGWNYRIENPKTSFRFSWIFMIPFFGMIVYFACDCILYTFGLMNYVIVGLFGLGAIAMALIFYAILFAIVSVIFLSRKS